MPYRFNPHRHVKIWLSKDKNSFLNLENRIRLVKMRDINPRDEINFIYDSGLLSEKALAELNAFCAEYNIVAKDIKTEVIPFCETQEERQLICIYTDEMAHLNQGGNVAVGSDIVRWLKPVYELGTYTDFDVDVDTRGLPDFIDVEKPLLMNLGSYAVKGDVEALVLNNDTIAVVDSQAALPEIQKIQSTIYSGCSTQPMYSFQGETHLQKVIQGLKTRLGQVFSPESVERRLTLDLNYSLLPVLEIFSKGKTAREMRQGIIGMTQSNRSFGEYILREARTKHMILFLGFSVPMNFQNLTDADIETQAAEQQRAELAKLSGWIGWLFLPKNQYQQIQALLSIQDNRAFLTKMREQMRMTLLKDSVVYTSGPGALLYALFDQLFYKKVSVDQDIAPFSFSYYQLDKVFTSGNSSPLHSHAKAMVAELQHAELGKSNDLSWLEEGENATAVRERKIIETQLHTPQDFQDMREKIAAHIEKIQADLQGCFGFYRHKERHAKIAALQNIMTHFEGGRFDLHGFNAALDSYRTQDVSASIGKSKTKALIDELAFFGQRAKHYMLTDEQGKIHMSPSGL